MPGARLGRSVQLTRGVGNPGSVAGMRLLKVFLSGCTNIDEPEFEAGPFTVLFGKNNAGKTNILKSMYGVFKSRLHIPGQPESWQRRPHGGTDWRTAVSSSTTLSRACRGVQHVDVVEDGPRRRRGGGGRGLRSPSRPGRRSRCPADREESNRRPVGEGCRWRRRARRARQDR